MVLKEIERKFLVKNTDFIAQAHRSTPIVQAFLNTDPSRTVSVRLKGEKGYLTVKGKSEEDGASRFEWEKEITPSDVYTLLPLCEPSPIEKTRYEVWVGDSLYEVDIFHGENEGLIIAEIELTNVAQAFEKPDWLGTEVTSEPRYYNSALSQHPYKHWNK